MKYIFPAVVLLSVSGQVLSASTCETHIQLQLSSESDSGTWETYSHYSSETGRTVLPNDRCRPITWFSHLDPNNPRSYIQIQKPQWVSKNNPLTIGHQNTPGGDFFGTIMITMTWQPGDAPPNQGGLSASELERLMSGDPMPPAKSCVFYVAASGPAEPVTGSYGFHGAICEWEIKDNIYYLKAQ